MERSAGVEELAALFVVVVGLSTTEEEEVMLNSSTRIRISSSEMYDAVFSSL
jgi:hypothetical protein